MRRAADPTPGVLDLESIPQTTNAILHQLARHPAPRADAKRRLTAREEEETVRRRLDQLWVADQAIENVRSGRVHPVLYDVARDGQKIFSPSWDMIDMDASGKGSIGQSLIALMRGYLGQAEAYGRQHAPPAAEEKTTLLDHYDRTRQAAAKRAERLSCLVCVTLGNQTLSAEVTHSSDRRRYDHMARAAIVKAARSRPWPPDAPPTRACYRVTTRFGRVPPTPSISCAFDESIPAITECYYPFKKLLRHDVALVSAALATPSAH